MKKMIIALVVAMMIFSTGIVFGQGEKEESSAQAVVEDQSIHEIYRLMPKTSLVGIVNPHMPDRADIDKAWPKTPKDSDEIVIGWSNQTLNNPFFVALADKAREVSYKYGFDLRMLVAEGDVQRQSSHIDAFIAQGVDIMVIDPVDVLGLVQDMRRAVEAGIPVITIGTTPDASAPVITTIQSDTFGNGFLAGQYIAEQFDRDEYINAAMIIGVMGNSTSESRLCGMVSGIVFARNQMTTKDMSEEDAMLKGYYLFEEVKKHGKFDYPEGKFSVLAWGTGNWTEEDGLKAAEDILAANADKLNIILAENDFMGMGAIKALKNIGKDKDVLVAAAADGVREAFDAVKRGELLCTGLNSSECEAESTIELIRMMFQEGFDPNNLPMTTAMNAGVVTKETYDKYYDPDPSNPFFKYSIPEFKSIPEIKSEIVE